MKEKKQIVKKEADVEVLTAAEVKKIEEAVMYINDRANAQVRSLVEIGRYLLKNFFEDDPKKAEERGPRKGISLRKISEHTDIVLTFKTLSNAVRLAGQDNLFRDVKYQALSETHRLGLLSVADPKKKLRYADKVVAGNLSVRALRDELEKAGYIEPRGRPVLGEGKPPKTQDPYETFFRPLEKLLRVDVSIQDLDVAKLSEEQLDAIESLRKRLDELLKKARPNP